MWYFVTGRIPFEDEDTGKVVEAHTRTEAIQKFRGKMLADDTARRDGVAAEVWAGQVEAKPENIWVSFVVECSDIVEPVIVRQP